MFKMITKFLVCFVLPLVTVLYFLVQHYTTIPVVLWSQSDNGCEAVYVGGTRIACDAFKGKKFIIEYIK